MIDDPNIVIEMLVKKIKFYVETATTKMKKAKLKFWKS